MVLTEVKRGGNGTSNGEFTAEQVTLIKNTVAKGATDDEFELFMYRANSLGLDPLSGQIHFIKRKSWNTQTRTYDEKGTIQIGIDGFRAIAERTTKYAGQDPIIFVVDREGAVKEVEYVLPTDKPIAARAAVYKEGMQKPIVCYAHYTDYVQTDQSGNATKMWKKWAIMLPKCAEALSFRKAFPDIFSSVYEYSEIPAASADAPETGDKPEQSPKKEAPEAGAPESKPASSDASGSKEPRATPKQIVAINSLFKKNGVADEARATWLKEKLDIDTADISTVSMKQASAIIEELNKNNRNN